MKVIEVTAYGESDVLALVDRPEPTPASDQVIIANHYAGVNFIDIAMRRGWYPFPAVPTPFVPGTEGAGMVLAIGSSVGDFKVGDRVAYMQNESAGLERAYSELIAIEADKVVPLPDDISFETAAAMTAQGMTTHYMLNEIRPVQPDMTVLVHAAAGGMGRNLVQWAKHLGATVIGTCSTSKVDVVKRLGADCVIDYTRDDFVAAGRDFTNGRGVDLIIDGIGKTTLAGDLELVATRGNIVTYGLVSGEADPVNVHHLIHKSRAIHGCDLFDYIVDPKERRMRAAAVWQAIREGWLTPQISGVYSLGDAAAAQDQLIDRSNVGKIVIKIKPPR
ncbi:quinone oxidoreductase family protein [Mesorhizobium captivum]|uniref:quinone oxidoreductase family protein n=1 Tax=Mesorhizobium captivum TaxID=3072319 RepID=UPI002A239C85|nr:quinone oxidoreductase [Mesorhizobium sp. VK22E]MDX8504788.1 quinone oxidoreductase [Mesorhizobium sp. VK22E]